MLNQYVGMVCCSMLVLGCDWRLVLVCMQIGRCGMIEDNEGQGLGGTDI